MNLRRQAARGVVWTGSGVALATGVQFAQWAILARLLEPSDFGLLAMVLVVIGLADAFADLGVSAAIVHRQHATRHQLSSLYWLNCFCGVVVFFLVVGGSRLVAAFYGEPRVADLVACASLTFLITPLGQQFRVLLQKDLRFRTLARIDVAGTIGGAVVAISAALAGAGVWSLIWGVLSTAAIRSACQAWIGWRRWRPRLRFRSRDLEGFVSFGLFQVGERIVNYFAANVDYLVIGRFLGPHTLGYYTLAYQFVVMPLMKLNPVVTRVAFPVFARRQADDDALKRGYLEMSRLLGFVVCPLIIGLAVTAPLLIPLLVGETWRPAVPLVQILGGVGLVKALSNPSGSLLLAKGRADVGFAWNLVVAALNTAAFLFVVHLGPAAVAWTYLGLAAVCFLVLHGAVLHAVIGLRLLDVFAALRRPLLMSAAMGTIVAGAFRLLDPATLPAMLVLVCLVGLGVALYAALALLLEHDYLNELWRTIANQEASV